MRPRHKRDATAELPHIDDIGADRIFGKRPPVGAPGRPAGSFSAGMHDDRNRISVPPASAPRINLFEQIHELMQRHLVTTGRGQDDGQVARRERSSSTYAISSEGCRCSRPSK